MTCNALGTVHRCRCVHGSWPGADLPVAFMCALGLVTGTRQGRSVVYSRYDSQVAMLLDEAVHHIEHLGLGVTDDIADTA